MKNYSRLLLALFFCGSANAAEIIFLDSPETRLDEKEMVKTVSEFYGLDLTTYELRIDGQRQKFEAGFGQRDVVAV
ncbi:MAG: hypothetical protein IH809_07850, partial [Proteobacteria bacterium]|nr:hypothetical protein [Pseudomonadota bacterium]